MHRKLSDWGGSIAAFLLVILVNYLSNALPINGQTPKDVSDKYASLFTPDSFTFAIWGVIYLALTLFVIYQALPAQRNNPVIASASKLFIISCIANVTWIFTWHYDLLWLSLCVMLFLLNTLILIYRTLGIARHPASFAQRLCLFLPFSLYTGWITVATIANLSVLQTAMGWDNSGLMAIDWTVLKLGVAGVIAALVIVYRGDLAFGLVVAWAAYGIMSKQAATPTVAGAAELLAVISILLVAMVALQRWFRADHSPAGMSAHCHEQR